MALSVNNLPVMALVDTGSVVTLIDSDTFDNLQTGVIPQIGPDTPNICDLNGHPVNIRGICDVNIQTNIVVSCVVVPKLGHQMILGSDALQQGNAIIDYTLNMIDWHGELFQLEKCADSATVATVSTGNNALNTLLAQYEDISQKAYRLPLTKKQEVERQLHDMLEQCIIKESSSSWSSPITLVPKRNGEQRFCVDYRKLNAVTHKDAYPLPNIQDIFDNLDGAKVFTTLDLKSGYWQIPIAAPDQPKSAFITHMGLFEFQRMPFGLCNAPGIFQRTMNKVLHGLVGKRCLVYLDDGGGGQGVTSAWSPLGNFLEGQAHPNPSSN